MLPENINFGFKPVNIILVIAVLGFICLCFVLWYEAKKDGFNTLKFFDLISTSVFLSGVVFYLLSKLIGWLVIFRPYNPILSLNRELFLGFVVLCMSLVPIFFYTKKWKWSAFRVLDIYSLGFSIFVMILSVGEFLVYGQKEWLVLFILLLTLYLFIFRYRGYRLLSGLVFSIFLVFLAVVGFILYRKGGYLLFYPILVTMSMLNLYLRGKKTMARTLIPDNFIAGLKQRLIKKERSLEKTQQQLVREDPYLQQGRDTDNAEIMDEVTEDTGKTITDARMSILKKIRIQVKRALAAIKLGRYGICEVCGKPIDRARLTAYPEATTCISCATDISQIEEVKEE
jgi:RNA polymerase-binding transcription factor DksA